MMTDFHSLVQFWFHFVQDWGYAGVVLLMAMESSILPVPSEVVIPPAAYWAAQGRFSFEGVVLAGTLGSYLGSVANYFLAWWLGKPLLQKYGRFFFLPPSKLNLAEQWMGRWGALGIFFARLLPVVRHLISLPAGLFKLSFTAFSVTTLLGSGLWCWILAWFGERTIGQYPELMHSPENLVFVMKEKLIWFVLAILVFSCLYAGVIWFQSCTDRSRS